MIAGLLDLQTKTIGDKSGISDHAREGVNIAARCFILRLLHSFGRDPEMRAD